MTAVKFVKFTCNFWLRHDEQVQAAVESREDVPVAPPQGRRILAIEQFVDGCQVVTEEGRLQHQLAIMCSDGRRFTDAFEHFNQPAFRYNLQEVVAKASRFPSGLILIECAAALGPSSFSRLRSPVTAQRFLTMGIKHQVENTGFSGRPARQNHHEQAERIGASSWPLHDVAAMHGPGHARKKGGQSHRGMGARGIHDRVNQLSQVVGDGRHGRGERVGRFRRAQKRERSEDTVDV